VLLDLDERTEGLAPLIVAEIWRVIAQIRATGISTLIVDRNVRSVLAHTDRALVMEKGRIVQEAAPTSWPRRRKRSPACSASDQGLRVVPEPASEGSQTGAPRYDDGLSRRLRGCKGITCPANRHQIPVPSGRSSSSSPT
jgi:energy-coupling factor transporter ATP-binding protein EcfA2